MLPAAIRSLLGAVRHRLWRGQLVVAARLALWASAALMLVAAAVHLWVRPVGGGTVAFVIAVLWAATLAWAGMRRPSDSACALWADRNLGGKSAFATLLELRSDKQIVANAQALQRLEQWATSRVPDSARRLAGRHDRTRVARPLFAALVCAALAALVLALPRFVTPPRLDRAALPPSQVGDHPAPAAESTFQSEPLADLASALRPDDLRPEHDHREGGQAPAAAVGKIDNSAESAAEEAGAVPRANDRAAGGGSPGGGPVDADAAGGATRAVGAPSGREAGSSRDDRAESGASRLPRSPLAVRRVEPVAGSRSSKMQAEMNQPAKYDDQNSGTGAATAQASRVPAAATPPPATEATRLTPTEAIYVQAWMQASGQRR
jgi:hypothetical protein